jgi:hypothetical protein
VEGEVVAPLRCRHVAEHRVEFGEEFRLRQREAVARRDVDRLEERGPVEMRRGLVRFGDVDEVVAVLRIAQFHARQRGFREARFEGEDALGFLLRLVGLGAGQFEEFGDMRDVGFADRLVVVLVVVVRRRQAEAALARERDLAAGVLEIRAGAEAEHERIAFAEGLVEPRGDVFPVLQFRDRGEVALDRRVTGFLDGRFVHARAVQPADLLFDRTLRGLVGVEVRLIDDLVLRGEALLAQFVECAPACLVRGNRIGRDPFAVRVGVEVGAGGDVLVEIGNVEHLRGTGLRGERERNQGGQQTGRESGHGVLLRIADVGRWRRAFRCPCGAPEGAKRVTRSSLACRRREPSRRRPCTRRSARTAACSTARRSRGIAPARAGRH